MRVALNSLICPIFCFSDIRIGMDPIISITANKVKDTVSSSFRDISIKQRFGKDNEVLEMPSYPQDGILGGRWHLGL